MEYVLIFLYMYTMYNDHFRVIGISIILNIYHFAVLKTCRFFLLTTLKCMIFVNRNCPVLMQNIRSYSSYLAVPHSIKHPLSMFPSADLSQSLVTISILFSTSMRSTLLDSTNENISIWFSFSNLFHLTVVWICCKWLHFILIIILYIFLLSIYPSVNM